MSGFRSFEEIEAWQRTRQLAREVYAATRGEAFSRDFALRDQIRRAAISAVSNIAEGFERSGNKEFVQFLSMAKGSVGEVKAQLYLASDERYVSEDQLAQLLAMANEAAKLIGGLMSYLRKTEMKGQKYK